MLPTPDLTHLNETDYDYLYEPAEDSFLLLDCLESEGARLLEGMPSCPLVLEIGPGTGIVISFIQSQLLGPQGRSALCLAVDVNGRACHATLATSKRNLSRYPPAESAHLLTETLRGNLLDALHLHGQVDLLLFNPPYVPTAASEIDKTAHSLAATWAGGPDGLDISAQLFPLLKDVLSPRGVFYLVAVARNRPDMLIAQASTFGCLAEKVLERRAGREKLCVLKFSRLDVAGPATC